MIRGYYCLAPGLQLSQATLERFLTGIGLKGYGVPEQPQDLAPPPLSPSDEVGWRNLRSRRRNSC